MRSMVEGHVQVFLTCAVAVCRACPATSLRLVPLPRWGRIDSPKRKWPMNPAGSMGHRLAEASGLGGGEAPSSSYAGSATREVRQPVA